MHGEVGKTDQIGQILGLRRIQSDAGAGPDMQIAAIDFVGLGQRREHRHHNVDGRAQRSDRSKNQRELIAADAAKAIAIASPRAETLGHGLQQPVADLMTERVIDHLEVIEIEVNHGNVAAFLPRSFRHARQLLEKAGAVAQMGHRVSQRQPAKFCLGKRRLPHLLVQSLALVLQHIKHGVECLGQVGDLTRPAFDRPLAVIWRERDRIGHRRQFGQRPQNPDGQAFEHIAAKPQGQHGQQQQAGGGQDDQVVDGIKGESRGHQANANVIVLDRMADAHFTQPGGATDGAIGKAVLAVGGTRDRCHIARGIEDDRTAGTVGGNPGMQYPFRLETIGN